jgi:hypothetical protein
MENFKNLYGILYGCPAGERCKDCPIEKIETLSFKDKKNWFDKLNYEEKSNIHKQHIECSNKRGERKNNLDG